MRALDRSRLGAAALALAVPAIVFALNAVISFRERGIVEPFDIPAAIAFVVLAVLAWRGSRPALIAGAALAGLYLVSTLLGGPAPFLAYWVIALLLILQTALLRPGARAV